MTTTQDYTPEEVADALRVHRETVYRWLNGHKGRPPILRGYRLPNKSGWRVTPADLDAFKQQHMNLPAGDEETPGGPETTAGQEG